MDYVQKVQWSEGMFLTPHHLQQWDRHFEHVIGLKSSLVNPTGWGVSEVDIDTNALEGGELVLRRCRCVMPDGTPISIPDDDESPAVRQIGDNFDARAERLGVYLALRLRRPGVETISTEGVIEGRPTRFRTRTVTVRDDNPGGLERDVPTATHNLRIVFENESLDDTAHIRIAELTRTATGAFQLAESYVAPALQVASSPWLMGKLRKLIEILSTRSTELASTRRQRSGGLVEFTMSEAANFWYLHTVNAALPGLLHFHAGGRVHPERVYLDLAHLAGKLFTFSSEGHPKDIPPYQHDNLFDTFSRLDDRIRKLLETIIPTRCVPVPLKKARESIYIARITDDLAEASTQFFLAVQSSVDKQRLVREFPIKTKISSLDRLQKLIAQAMKGVGLLFLPAPPQEIPIQPGRSYFQIEKVGEHWDASVKSGTISFYVPPEFTDLKLELLAVKE